MTDRSLGQLIKLTGLASLLVFVLVTATAGAQEEPAQVTPAPQVPPQAPKKADKAKSAPESKRPRAIVTAKGDNIKIEFKDIDLDADEVARLKDVISEELDLDDTPGLLEMNVDLKITKKMLDRADIDYSRFKFDAPRDDEFFHRDWKKDNKVHFKFGDKANTKILHDLKVKKGEKFGDIAVIGGNLDLEGEADDVAVILGDARIAPGAVVNGDLAVVLGRSDVSSEATVRGEQVTIGSVSILKKFVKFFLIPAGLISFVAITPFIVFARFIFWVILWGFAILIFYVFPQTGKRSIDYLKMNFLACAGFGILGLLLIVPAALFLALSIIGIPLLPVFAALVFLMLFGGYAVMAKFVGTSLPVKLLKEKEIWALLAGVLILGLVTYIPGLGSPIRWAAVLVGFGSVFATAMQMIFRKKAPPVASIPPAE